jgi:histone arginine demethylase JMJD6
MTMEYEVALTGSHAGYLPDILPVEAEVPRLSARKAREYLNQRVLPARPVVLTDIMDGRTALWKWTPAFFRERYPDLTCEVDGSPVPLREQLDRIATSSEEHPAPYPYSFDVARQMPELLQDLEPVLRFGSTDRTFHPAVPRSFLNGTIAHELFFGGRGASYPLLHYDLLAMHTQITQIHGDKEFFLYDPTQTPLLYPEPDCPRVSRIPDVFAPDLSRFPAFSRARPTRVLLRQGETLFFPSGWWHTTRIHGPSITYGRAVLNASNWRGMLRERRNDWRKTHPLIAWPAFVFGRVLGGALSAMEAVS